MPLFQIWSIILILLYFCCSATPLMVARSWRRNWLENILSDENEGRIRILPSPCLSLPLMSIFRIARLACILISYFINVFYFHANSHKQYTLFSILLNMFLCMQLFYRFFISKMIMRCKFKYG